MWTLIEIRIKIMKSYEFDESKDRVYDANNLRFVMEPTMETNEGIVVPSFCNVLVGNDLNGNQY